MDMKACGVLFFVVLASLCAAKEDPVKPVATKQPHKIVSGKKRFSKLVTAKTVQYKVTVHRGGDTPDQVSVVSLKAGATKATIDVQQDAQRHSAFAVSLTSRERTKGEIALEVGLSVAGNTLVTNVSALRAQTLSILEEGDNAGHVLTVTDEAGNLVQMIPLPDQWGVLDGASVRVERTGKVGHP